MSQHGYPERLSNRSKGYQEGSGKTMEVLVETLTGTAFEMTVSPSDTVYDIKSKIFRVEGIPVWQQHLVLGPRELEDGAALGALSATGIPRLRLVLGLRGGPVATRRQEPPALPPGRLCDLDREDANWEHGCRVTLVVVRDGERVDMLRVRPPPGPPAPPGFPPLPLHRRRTEVKEEILVHLGAESGGVGAGAAVEEGGAAAGENAVTLSKMRDLRRRMDALSLRRRPDRGDKPEPIQKTRSEEALSATRLKAPEGDVDYTPYDYARYDAECPFAERYTLLPPIGASAEPLGDEGREPTRLAARSLAPIPTGDYGWLASGSGARLSASTSALDGTSCPLPALSRAPHSSQLHLAGAIPAPAPAPRLRCGVCRRRLGPATTHACRCGGAYCAPHRYSEAHDCDYDYKAHRRRL